MSELGTYVKTVVEHARDEARADGSAVIEAHHLLLAIAADDTTAAGQILASTGLDRAAIREALDGEFERTLGSAGVSLGAFGLPRPGRARGRRVRMGASAKLALTRGFSSGPRRKDLQSTHLLLGILQAQVGTVPRALDGAGVDRADLTAKVWRSLTDPDG